MRSYRFRRVLVWMTLTASLFLPAHLSTGTILAAEGPSDAPSSPPSDLPLEMEELQRLLDQALDALADSMQALSHLAEEGQKKFQACQSGESREEWCLKMQDALMRLRRLEKELSQKKEGSPPPE